KRRSASFSTARAALTTAFTPRSGIDPCAVTPRKRARSQSAPLWPMTGRLPVGSATTSAPARPSAPGVRARCAAPSQPVSSPATSTTVMPGPRKGARESCNAAATIAATPLFMSLAPRPYSLSPATSPPPAAPDRADSPCGCGPAPVSARRRSSGGLPEVRLADLFVREQVLRGASSHYPALGEHVAAVGDGERLVHVLLHQEHGHALL